MKLNPHKDITYIRKAKAKHSSTGKLDYTKFYNDINYISPGIHLSNYYDICLSLIQQGDSWLDAGCGSGNVLKKAIVDKNINVYGLEIVDKSIKNANDNGVKCSKGSITETFPFESDTFQLVTSTDVLEHIHIEDVQFAIKELYRVCKPDGHCLVAPYPDPDRTGQLHLTCKPTSWWVEQFEKEGFSFIRHTTRFGIVLKKERNNE